VIASCLAKNPDRRPQSFVEIAQQLGIDSPKTVRAARAIQPPTMTAATVPPPVPPTATSTTLPPLPKPAGLSPAKLALILGGAAALILFVLVAISVWYFASRKPAPPKTVVTTTQKSTEPQTPEKTSGMADKARDVFQVKPEPKRQTRSEPSLAPKEVAPSAPGQPAVPINDFSGG
jgi:hypothetical protein